MTNACNRLLRLPRVEDLTGLRKSQIYEAVERGVFSKPIQILEGGRAVGWIESEIAAYLETRIAARDETTSKPRKRATVA